MNSAYKARRRPRAARPAVGARPAVSPGRVDELGTALLKAGLKMYGPQPLRVLYAMNEGEITAALAETLGPNTPVGRAARRLVDALRDFNKSFAEATARVALEDRAR